MKLHSTKIFDRHVDQELGAELVRLRYDKLLTVVMGMVDELDRQGYHDLELGRKKLAKLLYRARHHLIQVEGALNEVYQLCEKYILEEKELEKQYPEVLTLPSNIRFTGYTFRV